MWLTTPEGESKWLMDANWDSKPWSGTKDEALRLASDRALAWGASGYHYQVKPYEET